jgi:hypothetical protein
MVMPRTEIEMQMNKGWSEFVDNMEKSLDMVESEIKQANEMTNICTDEWCEATEHYIDDLANALFSISEPRWSSEEDQKRIKELKRRVYDLYANYRDVYQKVKS